MVNKWKGSDSLAHMATVDLFHTGVCQLLGISKDDTGYTVYVQEIYLSHDTTIEEWIAQHVVKFTHKFTKQTGAIILSVDEDRGHNARFEFLTLPPNLIKPTTIHQTAHRLNYAGVRQRGLRETDRVGEWVRAIPLADKMTLLKQLNWNITPMQLLGIAESAVLSEALIAPPATYIVCQRVRLAYALPTIQYDQQRQPYDYDTRELYYARVVDLTAEDELALVPQVESFGGVELHQPMDCMVYESYVVIADGGGDEYANRLHVWDIRES